MKASLALLLVPSALAIRCFNGPATVQDIGNAFMFDEPQANHTTCVTYTIDCGRTGNLNVCNDAERRAMLTKKLYSSSALSCELAVQDMKNNQVSVTSYKCCTTEGCNTPVITDPTLQCNVNRGGAPSSAIIIPKPSSDLKCYSFSVDCSDPSKSLLCGGETSTIVMAAVGQMNCDDPQAKTLFPDVKCCTDRLCNGDFGIKYNIQTSEDGTTDKSDSLLLKMNALLGATALLALVFV